MSDHIPDELEPAGRDLRAYTDELRPDHRVVRNSRGEWVLLRHADVVEAARDAGRFSNAVSQFLQVPNGLDGDAHRAARATLDAYFTPEALAPFEPVFRDIARRLFAELPRGTAVDAVTGIGSNFAVRGQSGWLGWSADLEPPLLAWMTENHAASRSGDRARMAVVAHDFDAIIRSIIEPRRAAGDDAPDDLTTRLMRDTVDGRPFTDEEIVSILRNWTGGDLGSIALCVGVLFAFLAENPDVQRRLRAGMSDDELDAAIDEVLRIDDPFLSNRRRTTCPVHIAGVDIPEGAHVKLHWTSANRDTDVFPDPEAFDPAGNAEHNLVYGTGPHVCPGRPLATMELRIAVQEALAATEWIAWAPDGEPEREVAPVGGWARVPVVLT
ncbi:MAG TPA: cytochrome P450 [Propionibacterium sp.]|nr:cytochrome P450 [Propionibacterium sp.]